MYGNQEKYREDVMKLFDVTVPEGLTAKKVMQQAYLVYSTVSSVRPVNGMPIRARWQDQISHEHKIHAEILEKISRGERVEGIEEDPR